MPGKILNWFRSTITRLTELRDRPQAVALGIASGIFFGFIPLLGLKTLLAMGAAKLFRGNVVAAAIAVTLHDVILPLAPVILHWEYKLGHQLLGHPGHLPHSPGPEIHGIRMWFHWDTLFTVGLPLLVGSVIVAIPFALGAYFLALRLLEKSGAKRVDLPS